MLRNKWALRFGSIILVLIAWQIVGSSINPIFLSTPTAIASSANSSSAAVPIWSASPPARV